LKSSDHLQHGRTTVKKSEKIKFIVINNLSLASNHWRKNIHLCRLKEQKSWKRFLHEVFFIRKQNTLDYVLAFYRKNFHLGRDAVQTKKVWEIIKKNSHFETDSNSF